MKVNGISKKLSSKFTIFFVRKNVVESVSEIYHVIIIFMENNTNIIKNSVRIN